MLQTVRMEKVDEKNEVICLVSMFPSWDLDFLLKSAQNCKKMHFFRQFKDNSGREHGN